MSNKYTYAPRPAEEVQRRAQQRSSRYDSFLLRDVKWFKPRQGENHIRILPWIYGTHPKFEELTAPREEGGWTMHWGIDIHMHYKVGADEGGYLCLDRMLSKPCPICKVWRSEGIEKLKISSRILCRLIDRNNEKDGPLFWNMPLQVSNDISLASEVRSRGANAGKIISAIDDWEQGHDIWFDRQGEKDRTTYKQFEVDAAESDLCDDKATQDKWLEEIFTEPLLPGMLKFYDAEYLSEVLSGQRDSSSDDDAPQERQRIRGSSRQEAPEREEQTTRSSHRGETEQASPPRRNGGRPSKAEAQEQYDEAPPWQRGKEEERDDEAQEAASSRASGRERLRETVGKNVRR